MKAVLILIVAIVASSDDGGTFEARIMKDSYEQCVADAKQFEAIPTFMKMFVSIEARCEKILGGKNHSGQNT